MFRSAFPAITNRQSFIDEVEVLDADDGTPVDLTGCRIVVGIRLRHYQGWGWDYWPYPAAPSLYVDAPRLVASTDDGTVTIPDLGVFFFNFTFTQIASLRPAIYDVGATVTRDGEEVELLLGQLPVLDGVVSS